MSYHVPYNGSADKPYPPVAEEGWSCITSPDHLHFEAAQHYACSGAIGELPMHHYQDLRTPTGLYRFFHFDTPMGGQIGALHFDGQIHKHDHPSLIGAAGICGPGYSLAADGVTCVQDGGSDTVTQLSSSGGGNFTDSSGDAYTTGGSSGTEPIPSNDAACTWVPDATNPAAVAIATSISYSNTPVPFQNQAVYNTTIAGTKWRMVMWQGDCKGDGGSYHCVSTFRCEPGSSPPTPPTPPSSGGSSSSMGIIIAAIVAALGLGGAAVYAGKKKHAHA
jgi:hypothetical protein